MSGGQFNAVQVSETPGSGRAISARPNTWRLAKGSLLVFLVGVANGCYSYKPLSVAPVPGSIVSYQVTDRGRVALGGSIGPTAADIEGVVQSENDTAYVLAMRSVSYLNGQSNKWSGEQVVVGKQSVTDPHVRTFSRSKTAFITLLGVAALIVAISSFGLLGTGTPENSSPSAPPGSQQ